MHQFVMHGESRNEQRGGSRDSAYNTEIPLSIMDHIQG